MYWSRTANPLDILAWMLMGLLWWLGGWLLVTHVFGLKPRERSLAGLACGLALFITLSNLLAHLLPLPLAFWLAAGTILAGGLAAAIHANRSQPVSARFWLSHHDLTAWPQWIILLIGIYLFSSIGRGLALFDDYLHIPLVSVMATGDIPPHFYLDPSRYLAYHYGLQVLAASLVRAAGLFPWSAWDVSKALAISLTMVLGWLWMRRATASKLASYLGSALITLGGGARWVLLLLPLSTLHWVNNGVQLSNTGLDTGTNLFSSMALPWSIEGGGSYPFPFAYHNGIFVPVVFALGASGALPYLTVLLLLLLASQRRTSFPAMIVLSLVLASLALSAEHLFVLLVGGILLSGCISVAVRWSKRLPVKWASLKPWGITLGASAILSLVQGGFLTEAVRSLAYRLSGIAYQQGQYDYFTVSLRWPPGLISAHLGDLSLFDARQLVALLAELGPALFLAPLVTRYSWRQLRKNSWLSAGLGMTALLSFTLALFTRYGVERSSTRLPAISLWLWIVLGIPSLWKIFQARGESIRTLLGVAYTVTVFAGAIIISIQMIAIPGPQLTYYLEEADARISRMYWNRLPVDAQVLDANPERAVSLFGRPARAYQDFYHPWPDWEAMIRDPEPSGLLAAGYSYIYMDQVWWKGLPDIIQQSLKQACVYRISEERPPEGGFRWLLDLRECQ